MKQLTLNQPLILIVIGLPGAGKSFFARQFAETFGVACVSEDYLRSALFSSPQFSREENTIIENLQQYMLAEMVKTKRSFLLDGGCETRAQRLWVEKLAHQNGYNTLNIWVQTDEATAKLRATKRGKKPEDLTSPSLSADQFQQLSKRFALTARETYLVISGKHPYSTQARTVLRKLAAPRRQAAEQAHKKATVGPRKTSGIIVN